MSIARNATGRVDMAIPKITEFHSFSCIEEKEVFEARALPQRLDIRA